jgi:S1-C subfamily serine protease
VEQRTFVLAATLIGSLSLALIGEAAPSAEPTPPSAPPAAKTGAPPQATPRPAPPPVASAAAKSAVTPLAQSPGTLAPAVAASPSSASPSTEKPSAKLPAPKTAIEAAVQQVVMLERAGRPIGIGTLLSGDGRILTALSSLSHGNQIDAHYPEGQIVRVKLSHSDRAWDLALLTPEGDSRRAGLKASHDPTPTAGTKLHAVGYVKDKQLGASEVTIKAQSTLRGADSAELANALELPFAPKPLDVGGPLVNDKGEVVAIVARACSVSDKLGCTPAPYAVPVSAVRNFLRGVPTRRGPWIGLEAVAFDAGVARGVRVAAIAPESPAAIAGLHAGPPGVGDVVLAVNGTPVASAEAFADAVDDHAAGTGAPLRLTVLSEGRYREVAVMFRGPAPEAGPAVGAHDREFQSNPARPWPRAPKPGSVPYPYR